MATITSLSAWLKSKSIAGIMNVTGLDEIAAKELYADIHFYGVAALDSMYPFDAYKLLHDYMKFNTPIKSDY